MNAENAAKARMGKLRKQADELGISYNDDTTAEVLGVAIKEAKGALEPAPKVKAEAPQAPAPLDLKELATTIAVAVSEANRKGRSEEAASDQGFVEERYMDPDDQLADPVVYFTPQFFWTLPIKKVGGQKVKPPFGRIVFRPQHGSKVQNGSQFNTRYTSAYRCNSKREQAHIETSSYYGRLFFRNEKEALALSGNIARARRYSANLGMLNQRQAPELYAMASGLNIPMDQSMSLQVLRERIADKRTDQDMESDKQALTKFLATQGKEHLLTQ